MGVVFLHSYTVCGVDLTKFFVGVDFCDVIEAAFSDGDFILFGEVVKSDLIPIAFFTAGKVINMDGDQPTINDIVSIVILLKL